MPEAKSDVKAKEASPRRRPTGNVAKVKVELLDGSTMELDVEVSTPCNYVENSWYTKGTPWHKRPNLMCASYQD